MTKEELVLIAKKIGNQTATKEEELKFYKELNLLADQALILLNKKTQKQK